MIKYTLVCDHKHTFESWFASSSAYDKQVKKNLVACPICDSIKVDKALMAPRLTAKSNKRTARSSENSTPLPTPMPETAPVAMMSPQEQEFRTKLKELRDHLVKNSDNVGNKFPEEARKMHYGEAEHRSIYGEATPEEAKELIEEGVELLPLPVLPEDRN